MYAASRINNQLVGNVFPVNAMWKNTCQWFNWALSIRLENKVSSKLKINLTEEASALQNRSWTASGHHKSRQDILKEMEIVKSAQRNPKNFAKIYERYFESIFIYINRRVGDEEVTADICSNVFFKCLNNLSKYRFHGLPFSAWLFKIAINEVNLYFRKEKNKERLVSLKHEHLELLIEEMEIGISEGENRKRLLVKLLEALSPEEIVFLELRFFEGRSFKEMAYILGLTEVNAKIKTYRIIDKMKKHLYSLKGS